MANSSTKKKELETEGNFRILTVFFKWELLL
jgi:hypothetical protein